MGLLHLVGAEQNPEAKAKGSAGVPIFQAGPLGRSSLSGDPFSAGQMYSDLQSQQPVQELLEEINLWNQSLTQGSGFVGALRN